ncbi:MAG: hypothetical protein HOP08_09075 [Cyclobacteriaceae bacterium]|nr:hypothetical protein [Cyclobacteriaceae bacterium]
MITRAIENCVRHAKARGWAKTYWAFDIHGTMLKPTYTANEISKEFYPMAKEVMQLLSKRTDIVRILYTCSYPHEIEQYLEYFTKHDIHFDYVNCNPEVADGAYGYYKDKMYFNVLMDDKAGFDGENDWKEMLELIKEEYGGV